VKHAAQPETTRASGFRFFWSAEDQQWVGTSAAYPSLSHLADRPEDALTGIIKLQQSVALDELAELFHEMGLYD